MEESFGHSSVIGLLVSDCFTVALRLSRCYFSHICDGIYMKKYRRFEGLTYCRAQSHEHRYVRTSITRPAKHKQKTTHFTVLQRDQFLPRDKTPLSCNGVRTYDLRMTPYACSTVGQRLEHGSDAASILDWLSLVEESPNHQHHKFALFKPSWTLWHSCFTNTSWKASNSHDR